MVGKIEKSQKTLRLAAEMSQAYYGKPLIVTYSGGKDSDVLLHLAKRCLKPTEFEVLNSHTSVDAPETVYHIRKVLEECRRGGIKATIQYPKMKDEPMTMWKLIPIEGMPPSRLQRYCCRILKETSTPNRLAALGVRADESNGRKGRDTFGIRSGSYAEAKFFSLDHTEEVHNEAKDRDPVWDCTLIKTMREHGDTVVNPIYEWTDDEIWQYARQENIKMNPLYERGYKRVGCIGCPMHTYKQKMKEFADYPKYRDAYVRALQRTLDKRKAEGKSIHEEWTDGEAMFKWWIEEYKHIAKGQMRMEDYEK